MKQSNKNALGMCNKMARTVRYLGGMGFEVEDVVMGGDIKPYVQVVRNKHTDDLIKEKKAVVYEWVDDGKSQERQPMAHMTIDDVRIIFKA